MVNKGKVSTVTNGGRMVTVTRFTGEIVTPELVVPHTLIGALAVGDSVIYSMFEDNTGIILQKADGTAAETGGGGVAFTTDETLTLSPEGVLSVNTADVVEQDNTLPVTSAAVHTTVGNIEALLKLI